MRFRTHCCCSAESCCQTRTSWAVLASCVFCCASTPPSGAIEPFSGGFESPLRHLEPSPNPTPDPTRRPTSGWVDDLGRPITRQVEKRKTIADKPRTDRLLHAGVILVLVAAIGLWSSWAIRSGFRQHIPMWAPWPLIALTWALIVFDMWRRRSARVQIPRRLTLGECPGCSYGLAGLPTVAVEGLESAIRCPECGAVWRAERVGQPGEGKQKPRGEPGVR